MAYRFRDMTSESFRKQEEFAYIEKRMSDFLSILQHELKRMPLARLMCMTHDDVRLSGERQCIEVPFSKIPLLLEKVQILGNYQMLSHDEDTFYWLSETLVRYLEARNEELA